MGRLTVVTTPALADGFRLAGCETVATNAVEAAATIRALLDSGSPDAPGRHPSAQERDLTAAERSIPGPAVLFVTADLWMALDERLRASLESAPDRVVMALPVGTPGDRGSRAALVGEMLQRAIGFHVNLFGAADT